VSQPTGYKFVNPNLGPKPGANPNPAGVPAANAINNLGYQVTSRSFNFKSFAVLSWGDEWGQPDHNIYEMPYDRGFDSTDQYTTGLYGRGIEPDDYLVADSFYPDAPSFIKIVKNNQTVGNVLIAESI
jgi:hypothetical protein